MPPHWVRLLLFAVLIVVVVPLGAVERDHYRAVEGQTAEGLWAWRAWSEQGHSRLLVVDPNTLVVSLVEGATGDLQPRHDQDSTLTRLRAAASARREVLQNAGVRQGHPLRSGAWLTFDLCPSLRPLDRQVLVELEVDARPLPVFLEISGLWMAHHEADFRWLVSERDAGRLAITWVNHSENHRYFPQAPLRSNFLLLPATDLEGEVFGVEQRLLDQNELPSVFFRFPGLVSSSALVDQILALGLVPMGSSAWLAKQQSLRPGALVLVHANGNEPEGLELLTSWDHQHRDQITAGQWHWLSLADWRGALDSWSTSPKAIDPSRSSP